MRIIIVAPTFLKIVTNGFADAMAIFPFVILSRQSDKDNYRLLRHEQIHIYQQLELLLMGFYLWYVIEYLVYRVRGYSHYAAYYHLSFEQEARYHESHPNLRRKWFGFLRYVW